MHKQLLKNNFRFRSNCEYTTTENEECTCATYFLFDYGRDSVITSLLCERRDILCNTSMLLLYLSDIVHTLIGLFTLGDVAQIRKGLTVIQGDNSIFMLVEGVIAAIIVGLFATIYTLNIKDARNSSYCHLTFKQQLYKLYEDKFAFIVLTPAFLASIAFIVLPIVITVLVSFTNYAAPNHIPPKNLVDWVGIKNFIMLFKFKIWSDTFLGIALWTFIWAICATIFTFSFGFILALALAKKIYVSQRSGD